MKILTPYQKLPKNMGDLGKVIAAKDFKTCLSPINRPNLVTLIFSGLLIFSL